MCMYTVRKHRAPKGALRPPAGARFPTHAIHVRKHRAPKGALRPVNDAAPSLGCCGVRKHRAPKGALRLRLGNMDTRLSVLSQKAPSAKRCIKTLDIDRLAVAGRVRKHRAPKGALRHAERCCYQCCPCWSESTERQKVH